MINPQLLRPRGSGHNARTPSRSWRKDFQVGRGVAEVRRIARDDAFGHLAPSEGRVKRVVRMLLQHNPHQDASVQERHRS